ncbi:putative RNA recognition motif domain, nucleotide-binding alpha-beta plait domain superfamily [Helianthus debilis subsp. tardiflorus]
MGPWEVQNSKRRSKGGKAGLKQDISKFFVTNIPHGCRPWDLANAFRAFGEIAGAFIAKKKDKDSRTFGFVSFKGVRDLEDLKNTISKVKLGGNKLVINVARFAKENGYPRVADGKGGKGGSEKLLGGSQLNGQVGASHLTGLRSIKNGTSFLDALTNKTHVENGTSFLDALTNKTHVEKEDDVLLLDPTMFSLANLPGSRVVGRTLGLQELNSLKASMSEASVGGVSYQYLGGLYVLLTFDSEEMMSKMLSEKDSWSQWFSMLQPWLGQALPYERLAWVNVHGFLESDGDLSVDRLGILVDSGNKVNGLLKLSWQDKKYKVWVIEDNDQWFPEFLEDEEESSVASSEFGDVSEPPAIGDGSDKEDEEVLVSPV